MLTEIANEEAPDIRIIRSELSESLANLVALSVSKRPETRYQDGDQFAADLRMVLAEMSGGPAPAAPQATSSSMQGGSTGVHTAAPVHEKTAVFGTSAVPTPDFEKTAIHQAPAAPKPAPDFEKTAIHQTHVGNRPAAPPPPGPDLEI